MEMQLACALEVVAHLLQHVLCQYSASDVGHLKIGGVLWLQATSQAEAVEGQRSLVRLLQLIRVADRLGFIALLKRAIRAIAWPANLAIEHTVEAGVDPYCSDSSIWSAHKVK